MKHVKRILSAVIAGALLCAGSAFSTASAEETAYPRGDLNRDGITDVDDHVVAILYYTYSLVDADGVVTQEEWDDYTARKGGKHTCPVEGVTENDLDSDGRITFEDGLIIARFYAEYVLLEDVDAAWARIDSYLD